MPVKMWPLPRAPAARRQDHSPWRFPGSPAPLLMASWQERDPVLLSRPWPLVFLFLLGEVSRSGLKKEFDQEIKGSRKETGQDTASLRPDGDFGAEVTKVSLTRHPLPV